MEASRPCVAHNAHDNTAPYCTFAIRLTWSCVTECFEDEAVYHAAYFEESDTMQLKATFKP